MYNKYKYTVKMEYELKNKIITYGATRIHSVLIDYDYINKNMPVVYLKIAIDKSVLDDMKENVGKKTIILTINKFITNSGTKIEEKYIKEEFIYFLDNNVNYREKLDYNEREIQEGKEVHQYITIGLTKLDLINNNKKVINDIFVRTTPINMICKHLSHMKLLIEPLDNITEVKRLIIPPLDTVTKFIKYLDDHKRLYTTKYRLFYDFDKTYLVSSSGKKTPAIDELFNTVILNVHDTIALDSKIEGVKLDFENKVYVIELDQVDLNVVENVHNNISVNKFVAIGHDGEMKKVDVESASNKINNTYIARFRNDNLDKVNEYKHDIENKIALNVNVSELDSSIFTLNKEYIINFTGKLKDKTGKFILNRKRDIIVRDGEDFKLINLLTFDEVL